MTTNQLLNLDWRDNDNRYTLVLALQKIPPLAKLNASDIDLNHVEKAIHIMCSKYDMLVRIQQDPKSGDCDIWNCQIYDGKNLDLLGKVYGICIEEVFIKSAIVMYSVVRKRKGKKVKSE